MAAQMVKRVVIAGGGTAGWIAAAALIKQLGPLIDVTLVESDEIGTVGVGESTIPTTRAFHGFLGIYEQAFVRATTSTFKLGIEFENWNRIGDKYFHAFGSVGKSVWMADFQHFWLEAKRQGFGGDYGDYSLEQQAAMAGKFATSDQAAIGYAYHLDATAYAKFLRGLAEPAGVKRIEGKIEQVEQDPETGFVTALVLQSGDRIEGDLFIDCTGFRALLIEQTLKTGFDDWSEWLSTNAAAVVQTTSTGPARPYTRAIAHEAGWRWQIPLQHRVGNGLVYCSDYMSDDEASAKLLADSEGEALFEPRLLRFKAGARKQAWNKNVIAMGLSSGFIEPLESTSIHLIKIAVTRLIQSFPFSGVTESAVERFNAQSRKEAEHIRDFIILHYKLTERDDSPFWRRCRDMAIPDSLAERIALFRDNAAAYQGADEMFRIDSWIMVMMGQGIEPRAYHHIAQMMEPAKLKQALTDLKSGIAAELTRLPQHQQFVESYAGA
ncbi:tryptophan halogenase family protein [Sphingomonas crusticola]|uniref:tryptophan halogenase family protein n=1 Tax=Sphingomonas crusticola TaxID=1697973 RepID=UPI000E28098A|nr:tryptophan halogenase family protein [Sphingomonas crusticola]